jgi:hypothetical protein
MIPVPGAGTWSDSHPYAGETYAPPILRLYSVQTLHVYLLFRTCLVFHILVYSTLYLYTPKYSKVEYKSSWFLAWSLSSPTTQVTKSWGPESAFFGPPHNAHNTVLTNYFLQSVDDDGLQRRVTQEEEQPAQSAFGAGSLAQAKKL